MVASSITPQASSVAGINETYQAAAVGGDAFLNDGRTLLKFVNTNSSTRTLTITAKQTTANVQGFNPLTVANVTVTIPGSGTNGGVCTVGPFAQFEFNDGSGLVQLAYGPSRA